MSQAVGNTALAYARAWHQVDATDRILGKIAEKIALCPVDSGDYVIVTNCKKIRVSGRKDEQLVYRKHSMYPGELKKTPYQDMMRKKPEEIIRHAVSGMLPKNKLRDRRLERLRIFPGGETGVLGSNVLRSWFDGTLPKDWNSQQLVRDSQRILPAGMVDKSVKFTRKA
ncbi:60S ribosomal protein L23 [Dendrothele bispora CBS 962.96]|uniref:60S ribosomal protein L23 n=1 Tax=Dendrothele bispora (strain CBS 962.96) TaxID=1314807 RepID=A0A4S8LG33_DENBC|nr:60S ribosomal protein L23 [Dendrothele bispora CBS 962.96]